MVALYGTVQKMPFSVEAAMMGVDLKSFVTM